MGHEYGAGIIRKPGTWHSQEHLTGGTFTGPMTAEEAAQRAQIADMTIEARPVSVYLNGEWTSPAKKAMLVRLPTQWDPVERILSNGLVTTDYNIIQVMDMVKVVDKLIPPTGRKPEWPLEHACVLKKGEIVLFLLATGQYDVLGQRRQRHRHFLCYTNHNDGATSRRFWFTDVRAVCWNTYGRILREVPSYIAHSGNGKEMDEMIASLIVSAEGATIQAEELMNKAAVRQLAKQEFADFVEAVFPGKPEPGVLQYEQALFHLEGKELELLQKKVDDAKARAAYWNGRTNAFRMEAAERYVEFNRTEPDFAHTAYAAFNAGTAVATHSGQFRSSEMVAVLVQEEKRDITERSLEWLKQVCE